jgi:hypothetical protein
MKVKGIGGEAFSAMGPARSGKHDDALLRAVPAAVAGAGESDARDAFNHLVGDSGIEPLTPAV